MNHKSQPSCCDKGYAYDNQTARCTHNPFCSLECVEREGTRTTLVPKTTQASTERTTILVYLYNNINYVGGFFGGYACTLYLTLQKKYISLQQLQLYHVILF